MKIIDLLNKIANGEEVPKNIKVDDKYYMWSNSMKDYEEKNSYRYLVEELETEELNDEVEIIEEDKKIEKLVFNKYQGEDILVNGVSLIEKVNEIIDKLNKEE